MMRFIALALIYYCISLSSAHADQSKYSAQYWGLQNTTEQSERNRVVEFWGYHTSNGSQDYSNTLKLRYYQPIAIGNAWKGTARLDTSYVDQYGPDYPAHRSGQYSAGNTMLTIWGNHPGILPTLHNNLGFRVIFPFGNNGQWAIGPQVGSVFRPKEASQTRLTDFSPLVRYMYGFDTKNNSTTSNPSQPALLRTLELYPTLGFRLGPDTQLRLWDENGIDYNTAGGGWFVPLDAMVTHRLNKHWLIAVGASKRLIQTYSQYDWSTYAKLSLSF